MSSATETPAPDAFVVEPLALLLSELYLGADQGRRSYAVLTV
jgi:hypothetical protein